MNPHYASLMTSIYDGPTRLDHPAHLADLRKSGLTGETIALQKITDVPPNMFGALLGFQVPLAVQSMYLLPFFDAADEITDHIRGRIFPPISTSKGTIKYLQPRDSGTRVFFPRATLDAVLHSAEPLYVVEGEKKSLCLAQLGLPSIGLSGVEGWHAKGSRDLHPDLDDVGLLGREVDVLPDGDWRTNPAVNAAVRHLAEALVRRGARPQIIDLADLEVPA